MDAADQLESANRYSAFAQTHWTIVQRAADADSGQADAALESLCHTYWPPLYQYIRRRGYNVEDAQDLTQAFFARLLEKQYLAAVDRRKGKFRSFLLATLEHFLANEWRNSRAQKRGGHVSFISYESLVEAGAAEGSPLDESQAQKIFEREWATALLNRVLARLETDFAENGRSALFKDIKGILAGDSREISYNEISAKHRMTEAAVKMAVHRLRKRYGELLLEEVSNTVSTPADIEDEMRALFAALS
jgi:RNA polymerase sigma factor (sigma-70 family)